jgi:2-amino-4-hydroxy-6-hydroxymethyldihydropteridine diphosphokinase
MTRAYIGLGSNLGDRLETLASALSAVDALEDTAVLAVSQVYESEAWPDASAPPFANAVAVVETSLEADVLLRLMGEIEAGLGRETGSRNAPRTVDLDIVLFGDEEWDGPEVVIPHPRFQEREFVVRPLLEVDPLVIMPDGSPVSDHKVAVGRITGTLGMLPGFEDVTQGPAGSGLDEEWVMVAEGGGPPGSGAPPSADALLLLERSVLEQEGIPFAWDPYPPELWTSPWGLSRRFRLMVPEAFAERARRVLHEAVSAPPDPGGYQGDEGEPE